ncbi:MAG: D-tyrosyl-tRNA(Tyr) deacylase [Actinomycetia bacterium]|nr:D-tyrosyl-tRNA(Tyr) deacylase [Actinomycetes bacterium]
MRAVVQRVTAARVEVGGEVVGAIGPGLLVLVGVGRTDTVDDARWLADKVVGLRVFPDEWGAMNRSVVDVAGEVLSVSQFTLYGDVARGRRPSFAAAAPAAAAEPLWETFNARVRERIGRIATGRFGADMAVHLTNWGPVTIWIDSARRGGSDGT